MADVRDECAHAVFVTERVCAEIRGAQTSWAHFEAINGENDETRQQLRRGVDCFGLGDVLRVLVRGIVRDTLMALFRATDEPQANRLTFCRLSLLLESDGLREDRIAAARKWSVSTYPELRVLEASKCQTWMQAIRDAAPPKWDKEAPPPDRRLFDLRSTLLPMRHNSLAHALDGDGDVVINDVRKFLEITSELAQHAELIFRGVAPNWQFDQRRRLRETNIFWDRCQDGFGLQQTKTSA